MHVKEGACSLGAVPPSLDGKLPGAPSLHPRRGQAPPAAARASSLLASALGLLLPRGLRALPCIQERASARWGVAWRYLSAVAETSRTVLLL